MIATWWLAVFAGVVVIKLLFLFLYLAIVVNLFGVGVVGIVAAVVFVNVDVINFVGVGVGGIAATAHCVGVLGVGGDCRYALMSVCLWLGTAFFGAFLFFFLAFFFIFVRFACCCSSRLSSTEPAMNSLCVITR